MKASKADVASGMIHAASNLPVSVVKAMLEDYFIAEAAAYPEESADATAEDGASELDAGAADRTANAGVENTQATNG